jgi:transposase-like protein
MPREVVQVMSRKKRTNGREDRGRWSSKRKTEVVLRLLRGEDVDTVSREIGVTAATISSWRDEFIAGGQTAMKSRAPTVEDERIQQLQAKLGEVLMENELLWKRAKEAEAKHPFPWRRSTR